MSFLRLVQLKRGLMARLVALGLMPGEPAVAWDDDAKPRLLIGDRAGVPRELQPGQHTHPDADLEGISWIKVTQVPATFPPAIHVHVIGDVTGLQVALDGKAALGHTHDFSAVYAPLNHTHAWSQLTGVPATFTPPMASGVTLGGIKVGGGLAIDAQGVLSTTYTYSLPTASGATLGGIKVGGGLSIDAQGVLSATYSYTLPIASGTVLGGVKAGVGVSIDAGGALTVTYAATAGSANAVAWTAVTGRPSALSAFTNDPGFITAAALSPYAPTASPTFTGNPAVSAVLYVAIPGWGYNNSAAIKATWSDSVNVGLVLQYRSAGALYDGMVLGPTGAVTFPGQVTSAQFNGPGTGLTGTAPSLTAGGSNALTGFYNTSAGNPIGSPDNVTTNGVGYTQGVNLFGMADGALLSQAYSSSWVAQIYQDFRTGQLAIRGKNAGAWQAWRTVVDSGNISAQSVNYASTCWSADNARYVASGGQYIHSNTDGITSWPEGVSCEFVQGANGWPAYGTLITARTYGAGGGTLQLFTPYDAPGFSSDGLQFRVGGYNNGTPAWRAFRTLIDSVNIANQAVNYASTAGACTGNSATATFVAHSSGRTDAALYPVVWAAGTNTYAYSCAGVQIQSSTNSLFCSGNVTSFYSDERLKENIRPIKGALAKALGIRGVTFNANALAAELGYMDASEQVGVIAQEVQRVLPQVIAPAPFDLEIGEDGEARSKSGLDFLTVRYERLVPLLFEALREEHELRLKDHQVMREEMGLLRISLLKLEAEVKALKRRGD